MNFIVIVDTNNNVYILYILITSYNNKFNHIQREELQTTQQNSSYSVTSLGNKRILSELLRAREVDNTV
jgi:hypothetical protein